MEKFNAGKVGTKNDIFFKTVQVMFDVHGNDQLLSLLSSFLLFIFLLLLLLFLFDFFYEVTHIHIFQFGY